MLEKLKLKIVGKLLSVSKWDIELAKNNHLDMAAAIISQLSARYNLELDKLYQMEMGNPYSSILIAPNEDSLWESGDLPFSWHKASTNVYRIKDEKIGLFKAYVANAIRGENLESIEGIPDFVEIRKELYDNFYPKIFTIKTIKGKDGLNYVANHRDLTEARKLYILPNLKRNQK